MFHLVDSSRDIETHFNSCLMSLVTSALYNIFIKKGSASIHPILGGVILQIVAALFGTVLCGYLTFGQSEEMFYDSKGIYWAVLAGFAV